MSGPEGTMITIKSCHDYLNGQRDNFFEFVPEDKSRSLMIRYGLSYKPEKGQIRIARSAPEKEWPKNSDELAIENCLKFALVPLSPTTINYTDIAFENINNSCFHQVLSSESRESPTQLKQYKDFPKLSSWLYDIKALGLVYIPFKEFTVTQTLKITFAARKIIWRFHLFVKSISSMPEGELSVQFGPQGLDFKKITNSENDASSADFILESTNPWPLNSRGEEGICLIHKIIGRGERTLHRNLPAASPQNLRLLPGSDIPRADIFVHI